MSDLTSNELSGASTSGPVGRRHLLRTGAALGLAAAGTTLVPGIATAHADGAENDPATREVILVGANPGIRLFDGDTVTAYASVWRVDWSTHGSGTAIITWHDDQVDLYTDNPTLGLWLDDYFTRHFPEVEGLPWPDPVVHRIPARVDIDLGRSMRARAGDLAVHIGGILDRRAFATDEFPLGEGRDHSLSLVQAPAGHGSIIRRGGRLPGDVIVGGTPDRPSSSAFIAVAEVWRAPSAT